VQWKGLVALALIILTLASCGNNPGYRQIVPGTFVRVGGPAPGPPYPLPGTITARATTGETFMAAADQNGHFKLALPPGIYRLTGRSPLMQGGQMVCAATAEVRVTREKFTGHVTVVCSIA
jgi:hypothetical protein